MKSIFIWLFACIAQIGLSQEVRELTSTEKEKDFLFLVETLKSNYPYFSLYERVYGKSWLSQKDSFLKKVCNTKNNKEYILLLDSIVKSLHDKEVDLSPTVYWSHYRTKYGEACLINPGYIPWVNTLNQSDKEMGYWSKLLKKGNTKETVSKNNSQYKDSIIPSRKIGILHISSFDPESRENDFQRINEFLYRISNYNYLIIDIQGNKGGSSSYWMEGIVKRLINAPACFQRYFAIKKGRHNSLFFSRYLNSDVTIDVSSQFISPPLELSEQTFKVTKETTIIYPYLPIPFKGEIIILTDSGVFSAADEFACFAQSTSWATVAGQTTAGGGIGSDPVVIRLPASGILVRYPALAGLNPNGSLHIEDKTIPDTEIKGNKPDERLNNLIDRLNDSLLFI